MSKYREWVDNIDLPHGPAPARVGGRPGPSFRLKPYQWLNTTTGEIMDTLDNGAPFEPVKTPFGTIREDGSARHIAWKTEEEAFGKVEALMAGDRVTQGHPDFGKQGVTSSISAPKFSPGQIVRLKSGGPLMTVCGCDDLVLCQWFDGNNLKYTSFPPDAVELEEKPA